MEGRMYGWKDGCMEGRMKGWQEGWMDGRMDRVMNGWMNNQVVRYPNQVGILPGVCLRIYNESRRHCFQLNHNFELNAKQINSNYFVNFELNAKQINSNYFVNRISEH